MCSVSASVESVWMTSAVEEARAWRRSGGWGFGAGRWERRGGRRARREEMSVRRGGGERGERRGVVVVRRRRVCCVRWVVREVWAVIRLLGGVVSLPMPFLFLRVLGGWEGEGGGGFFYRDVPFSMPLWLPRSRNLSATREITSSVSLSFASVPYCARCSIAAMCASSDGDMPSTSSGSEP